MFYLPKTGGGLKRHKSQNKIVEFFLTSALDEDSYRTIDRSPSTYEKWVNGTRNPDKKVLSALNDCFDADKSRKEHLRKELQSELYGSTLPKVMDKFGIHLAPGEKANDYWFAIAVIDQFYAIVKGDGEADNIVRWKYESLSGSVGSGNYFQDAIQELKQMRLPGNDVCSISEAYVCNDIGTSSTAFPRKAQGNYIEDATLKKIRTFDSQSAIRHALLIGGCGYGKTLMLRHLFIEAAEHRKRTNAYPIFAELRNFSHQYADFVQFIVDTVGKYDLAFKEEDARNILNEGRAQILLDGLDELDPGEVSYFQDKMAELCREFPTNMVIIATRQCPAIEGIKRFTRLYLSPMSKEQAVELIDRLLPHVNDIKVKRVSPADPANEGEKNSKSGETEVINDEQAREQIDKILKYMQDQDTKRIVMSVLEATWEDEKENGFSSTNPMLLTVMVRNYERIKDFRKNKQHFYELMYDTLIRRHDAEKLAFDRSFHSVDKGDEFTRVFREFCARTFVDGIFAFDDRLFEKYFNLLECKDSLANPDKLQLQAFRDDACATACMVFDQESIRFYVDSGFQKYFFADYYFREDADSIKEMSRTFWDRKTDVHRNFDAFRMLYQMDREKTEACVLLPFLDRIFKDGADGRSDDDAFMRYLMYGYGTVIYMILDEAMIHRCLNEAGTKKLVTTPAENGLKNAIMALVLDILDLPDTFVLEMHGPSAEQEENAAYFLSGHIAGTLDNSDESGSSELHIVEQDIAYKGSEVSLGDLDEPSPVLDSSGKPVCFGYVYNVDLRSAYSEPDQSQRQRLLEMAKGTDVYETFIQVSNYYKRLVERQKG